MKLTKSVMIVVGLIMGSFICPSTDLMAQHGMSRTHLTDNNPELVTQAQQYLKEMGYYKARVDGKAGPKTHDAIMQFQQDLDLPVTGRLDTEMARYILQPRLIFTTQDFAPFTYRISTFGNKVDGAVAQVVRAVCIEAKMSCVFQLHDWGHAQDLVRQEKAHGLFVIGWNAERAQYLNRSVPVIQTEYGVFVRDDNPLDFKQISDLNGYTVGVYGPSNTSKNLRRIENTLKSRGMQLHVKQTRDDKPLFKALSKSAGIRAVYSNRDVGNAIINGLGLDNIRYAGPHKTLLYYVGFSKELVDEAITDRFNETFLKLKEQGVIQEIYANRGLGGKVEPGSTKVAKKNKPNPNKAKIVQRYHVEVLDGKEVVVDETSCLMWQKGGSQGEITWPAAKQYVDALNKEKYAGHSDWRLPKIKALTSLLEPQIQKQNRLYIEPSFDSLQQTTWSADGNDKDIQYVDFYEGISAYIDHLDFNFVRAVRGIYCKGDG